VIAARIVPTDHIEVPAQEPVIPIQDMVAEALLNRPEVEQNDISLENARLDLKGVKNNLLPSLSATASFSNAGQGGAITNVPQPVVGANGNITYEKLTPSQVNQFLIGGYGTVMSQIFSRNFPNYSVGFQLTVPLRNRANQADLITNELSYRQAEIQDKELHNNIKLNVINAWTAVRNARAFLAVQEEFGSFDRYIWRFVDGRPIVNHFRSMKDVPPRTPVSDALSCDLKQRGFNFVGSTICYAHMQATGMVNDHLVACFRHRELGG